MARKDLAEVHLLRGVASVMVCLYHLILGNAVLFPESNWLESIFSYGYLGVEVFFIISGYVICYSLPAGFGHHQLGTFFLKRLIRIEPPYLASIVLVLVVNALSHSFTGLPNNINIWALVGHLAYLNNFFPGTYVNVVYWTLGIEAQFYLLIGLCFPLFQRSRKSLLLFAGCLLALACVPLPGSIAVILPYLGYFILGILLFFYKQKHQVGFLAFAVSAVLVIVQIQFFQGTAGAMAALFTVFLLLFWNRTNGVIRFFSTISYSLYLLHVPIGGKVINLGMRFAGDSMFFRYLLVMAAFALSVAGAYLFYEWVERPSLLYAKRIKYKPLKPLSAEIPSNAKPALSVISPSPVILNNLPSETATPPRPEQIP